MTSLLEHSPYLEEKSQKELGLLRKEHHGSSNEGRAFFKLYRHYHKWWFHAPANFLIKDCLAAWGHSFKTSWPDYLMNFHTLYVSVWEKISANRSVKAHMIIHHPYHYFTTSACDRGPSSEEVVEAEHAFFNNVYTRYRVSTVNSKPYCS